MDKDSFVYHSRKYNINERFFDKWSPEMAYILGFWFADGYMRIEKSYRIVFTSADRSILLQIKKAFSSGHPLRGRKEKKGGLYTWDLSLCSKYLYNRLISLGGLRGKSRSMKFPYVPSKYIRDFVRGYFDGDGSVFFVRYTRTKDKRITKELRTNFTSGSQIFLEELMGILHANIGLSIKKLGVFNNGGSLKLGYGMKDSDALFRYMYYVKFPIGLKRKAGFIYKIPTYQRHSMPNK